MTYITIHDTDTVLDDGPSCPHCGALLSRRQTGTMDLSVTTQCPECCRDL